MKAKKPLSLLLCASLTSCIGLAACDVTISTGDDTEPLAAPQISLSGNTITWNAVENADGYEVYEGTSKVASPTETSYTIMQTTVGTYTYTVYATSTDEKYTRSKASNSVEYKVEEKSASVTLTADKKIYVVGDSTVCDYSSSPDNYYLQRFGYGTQLYNYLNLSDPAQVVNLALSGRSSLSFLSEGNYNTLKSSIGEGDYLIIGFGHNDEKSDDAARFTDPAPDYKTASSSKGASFQYTLYENYVKLAKEKGATPILCTPIVRYNSSGEYEGKSVAHVTADGDYAAAIKKLGTDTETAVVDLTKITKDYYTANNDDAKYFHAFTTYSGTKPNETPDGMDSTHINKYGAKMISYWFATNLPAGCPLAKHVKEDAVAPTYDVDYPDAINTAYVKPDYAGFNPAQYSVFATTTKNGVDTNWYKTATGVLGGNKAGNYVFTKSDNKFTIKADSGSKFAATQDGFAAIFVQVDVSKNFTASAKAKVTDVPSSLNDQNALGMMLRDDIFIDVENKTLASNFVSASVTGNGKTNMSRVVNTALAYDTPTLAKPAKDSEYELTVTRVGQVVTVSIKQGDTTVETTFTDISFVGVDNTKMYLCLFANRSLTVEFSDVSFEITGEAQGA